MAFASRSLAILVGLGVALGACLGGGVNDAESTSPGQTAPAEVSPAVERILAAFPDQAAKLLAMKVALVETKAGDGFEVATAATPRASRRLSIHLPRNVREPVALESAHLSLRIHESSLLAPAPAREASGEGAVQGTAVAYSRQQGGSFWTATEGGFEEWLHLPKGIAHAGEVAAAWEVEGGTLRQDGELAQTGEQVDVLDAAGVPRVRVRAPAAYAVGGKQVPVRLRVEDQRIQLLVDAGGAEVLVDPVWTTTSSLATSRALAANVQLKDGRVLTTGGLDSFGFTHVSSAEIYDSTTGAWTSTPSFTGARANHRAAVLADGRVILAGGEDGNAVLSSVQLYDPATNKWTAGPALPVVRENATATLLPGGKVMFAGGDANSASVYASANLYDPVANSWSTTAAMPGPHAAHGAVLMENGKVLVVGGTIDFVGAIATADVYDPVADTWTSLPPMGTARIYPVVVVLPSIHRVLVTGGALTEAETAELFDPATNTWTKTGPIAVNHALGSGLLLPDGKVLVAGSRWSTTTAEIYDPVADTWQAAAATADAWTGGAIGLFADGSVLYGGGEIFINVGSFISTDRAEIWKRLPAGAACLAPGDCLSGFCTDGVCCPSACTDACLSCSVTAGTCTKVTNGPDADTCTGTKSCDGAGACRLVNGQSCAAGGDCVSTHCADGLCCDTACGGQCDECLSSPGTCKTTAAGAVGSPSCAPYVCGGASVSCPSSCLADADCAAGAFCAADGTCKPRLAQGVLCDTSADCKVKGCRECGAGACADGICCESACAGPCEQCGAGGVCGKVTGKNDADSCTGVSTCDAQGVCRSQRGQPCTVPGDCASGACADGVCCDTACEGACNECLSTPGTCKLVAGGGVGSPSCAPFACSGTSADCPGACSSDAECGLDAYCAADGNCRQQAGQGQACDPDVDCKTPGCDECKTGHCADGFCCDTACDGACDECASEHGVCQPAAAGKDGAPSCAPFLCSGLEADCPVTCASSADCAVGAYCNAESHKCRPAGENGSACGAGSQCQSGFCVDTVCCDKPCQGQCEACDLSAAVGTCSPIAGPPHGNRAPCEAAIGDDPCTARACDGENSATSCEAFVGAAVACREASCEAGVESEAALCDGSGTCPAPKKHPCAPFACAEHACKEACVVDADCEGGATCDAASGSCVTGATCIDATTLRSPSGQLEECAPYRCGGSKCLSTCASVDDCVTGFVCNAADRCVAPPAAGDDASGCSVAALGASREGGAPSILAVLGALGLSSLLRRRPGRVSRRPRSSASRR